MKRTISFALCFALMIAAPFTIFAGGQADATATTAATVTMWAFPLVDEERDSIMFETIMEDLHESHPEITIDLEFFPWGGRRERMLTAISARVAPDVAYLNDDMKPLYEGNLLDLNDYLTAVDLKDFKPGAIDGSMYKGVLCYLPVLINSIAKFANLEMLEKAGVPASWLDSTHTWEEFFEVCDKIKAAGMWPYTIGPQGAAVIDEFSQWVYQAGGDFYNEDMTKATMNTPEFIRALEAYALLWEKYINPADMDKDQRQAEEATFIPGRAAIRMAQNQAIVNIRELNPDLKVGLAYAMKDKKTISSGTIAGYGVFNQTEVPEAAVEWVKALTGETGMYLIDTTLNFIAPRFSVDARMAEDMDDPFYKRAVENSAHFVPTVPASPVSAAANEEISSLLMKMILKEATPAEVAAEMTQKVDALLNDYYSRR